jgi:hypothetical protein
MLKVNRAKTRKVQKKLIFFLEKRIVTLKKVMQTRISFKKFKKYLNE